MLYERDRAVVAEMCRTGMSLDVLKKCFPQFEASDVEKIYNENNKYTIGYEDEISVSCNCS